MANYEELMNLEKKPKQPLADSSVQNKQASEETVRGPASVKSNDQEIIQSPPLPANHQTGLEAKMFASLHAIQQGSKPANQQSSKEVSKQTGLSSNQHGSKMLKKFSSYLTEHSLKGLKRIAFETDRKDYEVLQEAVDTFLARLK